MPDDSILNENASAIRQNVLEMLTMRSQLTALKEHSGQLSELFDGGAIGHCIHVQRQSYWSVLIHAYCRVWDKTKNTNNLEHLINQVKNEEPTVPVTDSDEPRLRAGERAIKGFNGHENGNLHSLIKLDRHHYFAHSIKEDSIVFQKTKKEVDGRATRQNLIDSVETTKTCFEDAVFYLFATRLNFDTYADGTLDYARKFYSSLVADGPELRRNLES